MGAKRKEKDALCFIRFFLEQMLAPALKTYAKILNEGREPKITLLLLALVDNQHSKQLERTNEFEGAHEEDKMKS